MTQARSLKSKELQEVLQVIARHSHALRNRVMLLMTHWCGLRVSDLVALEIGDISNPDGSVKRDVRLRTKQGENQRSRSLFLPERLRRELAVYLSHYPQQLPAAPLFLTQKRTRFTPNSLSQHFLTLYRRCGLDGASAESGRRSFIHHLATQGASPRLLMVAAGYSRAQTAQSAQSDRQSALQANGADHDRDNEAANDTLLNACPNRNATLPGSVTQVSGYPDKLKIYLTASSSFWQVRCFFSGESPRQKPENRRQASRAKPG